MCFTLPWLEALFIQCVWLAAIIAIIKVVLPFLIGLLGGILGGLGPVLIAIVQIVLWAVVAMFVIEIIFGLLECLVGSGHIGNLFPFHRD